MAYLSESDLQKLGLRKFGSNVKISDNVRFFRATEISIGNNVIIDDFCVITGGVYIGNNVHIASFCYMYGGDTGLTMQDFSGLAMRVTVTTSSDDYSGRSLTNPTIPKRYKPYSQRKPINIGRHAIVGTGAVILPGAEIAEGTALGALSMLNRGTLPWTIMSGVPAKRIRDRNRDILEIEKSLKI